MIIDIDHQQVQVPPEIIRYCDEFTYDADRDDLRHIDCVYMHMGLYGNNPDHLRQIRIDNPPVKKLFM